MNVGTSTEDTYRTLAPLLESPYIKQLGPKHYNRPNGLYHTMVKEIAGYTVQGVIWYQGEADAPKASLYDKLFTALIECWRETWKDELPFLFVQLAPFRDIECKGEGFLYIRKQQEKVSKYVQKAYMASIMDVGMEYDVHPKLKRPVGERLALLALGKVYGHNILCEAPEVDQVMKEGNSIRITFHHAGEQLVVNGDKLNGLQVSTAERPVPYTTEVKANNLVIILDEEITSLETINIRFACSDYEEVNLYNSADLPAKPFKITI
ncbi:MAG: sialate O-acetylesterase [Paenibacillus sp.]|nr:sialate O-acetylesterase [Paenibacillus sp.]